jgi:hypothetical protein
MTDFLLALVALAAEYRDPTQIKLAPGAGENCTSLMANVPVTSATRRVASGRQRAFSESPAKCQKGCFQRVRHIMIASGRILFVDPFANL